MNERHRDKPECTNCSNVVYDDMPMCGECRWVSKDMLEEWFDNYLNDCYSEVLIGSITFDPSYVLKQCDPVAYRLYKSEYAEELAEDGRTVEGHND